MTTPTSSVLVPLQPDIREQTSKTIDCGVESRQVPDDSFYLLNCSNIPGTGDETYRRCDLKLVQNVKHELVPRKCDQRTLQLLTRVDQQKDPSGNIELTPHVDLYTSSQPLPIQPGADMYEYDAGIRTGGTEGGGGGRALLCGYPTSPDPHNSNPCTNLAMDPYGKCAQHTSTHLALHTGGGGGAIDGGVSDGGGVFVPASTGHPTILDDSSVSVASTSYMNAPPLTNAGTDMSVVGNRSAGTYQYYGYPVYPPSEYPQHHSMTRMPIYHAAGAVTAGVDGGAGEYPNTNVYNAEHRPLMTQPELTKILSGINGDSNEGFETVDQDIYQALQVGDDARDPKTIRFYTRNKEFGTKATIERGKGFDFSSRYYAWNKMTQDEQKYALFLSGVLLRIQTNFPAFTSAQWNGPNDSIETLQCKILTATKRILNWIQANANDLLVTGKFFDRRDVYKGSTLVRQGYFEGFEPFRDLKDDLGAPMIHAYLRHYAFAEPARIFRHPDFIRFEPAVGPRRTYVSGLQQVYDYLNGLPVTTYNGQSQTEQILGSNNFVDKSRVSAVDPFTKGVVETSDFDSQALLEAAILTLICKLMYQYGFMFNTNYIFNVMGSVSAKSAIFGSGDALVNAGYVHPVLKRYVTDFAYPDDLTTTPAVFAKEFVLAQEAKRGKRYPVTKQFNLNSIPAVTTGETIFGTNPLAIATGLSPSPPTPAPQPIFTPTMSVRPTDVATFNVGNLGVTPLTNPYPSTATATSNIANYGGNRKPMFSTSGMGMGGTGMTRSSTTATATASAKPSTSSFGSTAAATASAPSTSSYHRSRIPSFLRSGGESTTTTTTNGSTRSAGKKPTVVTHKISGVKYNVPVELLRSLRQGAGSSASSTKKPSSASKSGGGSRKVRTGGCGPSSCSDKEDIDI